MATRINNALEELATVGLQEVLDADSRPTFIIDLDPDVDLPHDPNVIRPIFCNTALRLHERLADAVFGNEADFAARDFATEGSSDFHEFKSWATGVTKFDDSKDVFPLSFLYNDLLWIGSTVRKRFRLISGNLLWRDLSAVPPRDIPKNGGLDERDLTTNGNSQLAREHTLIAQWGNKTDTDTTASMERQQALKPFIYSKRSIAETSETGSSTKYKSSLSLSAPDRAVADWTVEKPHGILTEHLKFVRSVDWSATPLGHMSNWTREFRQMVNLVMNNPQPAALFWGSEMTVMYNQAYGLEVAGRKHPSLMGTGFSGPFSELWDSLAPIFHECARTGVSVRRDNDYINIERQGLLEETFFSWTLVPLYGGGKHILGFYNAPFETTSSTVNQRRLALINKLGVQLAEARSVKTFWSKVILGLEDCTFDIPFALLYSVGDSDDADVSSVESGSTVTLKSCFLEGALGVPAGHVAAPKQLDLKRSREGFVPSFREAMRTREPTLLHTRDGTLPEALLDGVNWRGFGDACREAIIFPVRPTNGENVMAFLLVGVNPRRPYDAEYQEFTASLHRQLATSLASVMLFEDEVRRSRAAAEDAMMRQQQLNQELVLQTSRMRRMTELSPLGMYLVSPDGIMVEANDRYFAMTRLNRETMAEFTWMDCVKESSLHIAQGAWKSLTEDRSPWSGEVQFKESTALSPDGQPIDYWVLASAQPEIAPDGTLMSIMGSITEISHLKWAQGLQALRLQEAEETRRQQNEFIDITSHEIRNPLSATLQCAEVILSSLDGYDRGTSAPTRSIVEECLEAAQTIALCVQHQKAIVDDILTVSKLDSNLLLITPTPTQPLAAVKRVVKMFESELVAKDIKIDFVEHPSLRRCRVNWVTMDPSRILQVLINLMTNAIKFTAGCAKRELTVSIGASLDPPILPEYNAPTFEYIPPRTPVGNVMTNADWGNGETLYLRFKVGDTGCGLSREEKQLLFEKFQQASPRTHAQYGGSGLGLFISRQLAELHGGQIGVASEAGVGSTFGFFVTARRADTPNEALSPADLPIVQQQTGADSLYQKMAQERLDSSATLPVRPLLKPTVSPQPTVSPAQIPVFDPKALSVLVVEDNLVNQKVLVNQLKRAGTTVSAANDGIEALEYLEETHFRKPGGKSLTVALVDLEMPRMSGLECVRHIRQMEKDGKITGRVPVLAVTANVRDEQILEAKEAGMDDVVSKPFRMAELFQKIKTVLSIDGE